jgi:hypothetical protein
MSQSSEQNMSGAISSLIAKIADLTKACLAQRAGAEAW